MRLCARRGDLIVFFRAIFAFYHEYGIAAHNCLCLPYWASRDIEVPKPELKWFPGSMETWEIVSMIAKRFIAKGYCDIAQYADKPNAFHWFSARLP